MLGLKLNHVSKRGHREPSVKDLIYAYRDQYLNTLSQKQKYRQFAKLLYFVANFNEICSPVLNWQYKQAWVQIMAWDRAGDKPLCKPIMAYFSDAYMRHLASMI